MAAILGTEYRTRLVDAYLERLSRELPAVLVLGPRASGKTTTIARRAASIVRLDREAEAAAFAADPDAALRGLAEPVLLDEWQVVPRVLGAVRRAVDADPRPNRFYVTGSARAELDEEGWAGTGRLVRISMYPMTVREQLGTGSEETFIDRVASGEDMSAARDAPDLRGYVELALRGGFPQPALRLSGLAQRAWLESYLEDLLTRDVERLEKPKTRGRDTLRLQRYFETYALNSAGVCDHKTIYDAAGVGKQAAASYELLLSRLFVIDHLPAWTSNRLKRLMRQPKRLVIDAALMAAAIRVDADGVIRDGNILGRLLDTFVVAQLRPEVSVSASGPRLHHLRTEQGRHEIDVIVELGGGRLIAIEIKASSAPSLSDARHLAWLRDELGDRFVSGIILHTGPRVFALGDRLVAAPISTLWA